MKKIEAVIRPEALDGVKRALAKAGYQGITVLEVAGHGRQKGQVQTWRGEKYELDMLPKVLVTLVVADNRVAKVIKAVTGAARTGKIGDGKIFISAVADAIRIRTGERGQKAL